MGFRGAHRGYRYQDYFSAYLVLISIFKNSISYHVDEKDGKSDIIDDFKIIYSDKKVCYQMKYSKDKIFEFDDIKSDGQISIEKVIQYDAEQDIQCEYVFVLRWRFPTDLLKDYLTDDENYDFETDSKKYYKFDYEKYEQLCKKLEISFNETTIDVLNRIHFIIEACDFSGDINNPLELERRMLAATRQIGIGTYPNNNIDEIDFSIRVFDVINRHRCMPKYIFSIDNLLDEIGIIRDYGRVSETFAVDLNKYIYQNNKITKIYSNIKTSKSLIIGEPGAGKSYFTVGLMEYLSQKKIKYVRHYFYTDLVDRNSEKRVSADSMIGNIIYQICELFSISPNTYKADVTSLNEIIKQIDANVVIIIDGVDHAFREYRKVDDRIIDFLNDIELNDYIKIICISQPIEQLKGLLDFEVINMPSWTFEEIKELSLKLTKQFSDDILRKIYDRSKGNPLYATYLIEYKDDKLIEEVPEFDGNIKIYYEYLEKSISQFGMFQFVAAIPFYFTSDEFREITNYGYDAHKFIEKIRPLLLYNPIHHGYKIFHESFKRYIITRCEEDGINLLQTKKSIVEWLEKQDYFRNKKAYCNLLFMQHEVGKNDAVMEKAKYDYLIQSAFYGYPISAIKQNVEIMKKAACDLKSFEKYIIVSMLYKCLDIYNDANVPSFAVSAYLNASISFFGNDIVNYFQQDVPLSSEEKVQLYYFSAINGFYREDNSIDSKLVSDNFERDYYNMWKFLLNNELNTEVDFDSASSRYSEIDDLYFAVINCQKNRDCVSKSNREAQLYLNTTLLTNKYKGIDSYDFYHPGDLYKFDYLKSIIEYISYIDEKLDDVNVTNLVIGEKKKGFFESLRYLILCNKLNYRKLCETNSIDDYQKQSILNLKEFYGLVSLFSGKPRACDFTNIHFISLFIRQLLLPIINFKSNYDMFMNEIVLICSKLHSTYRGSTFSCISVEDILNQISEFLNDDNWKEILDVFKDYVLNNLENGLYLYNAEHWLQLSSLYSRFEKDESQELYRKGIEYSFTYGDHKDIFFDDVMDAYESLNHSEMEKMSCCIANMSYSLLFHTDCKSTTSYVIDWIRDEAERNSSGLLNLLCNKIEANNYSWITNAGIGYIIQFSYKSISANDLYWILKTNLFDPAYFDYDIYFYVIDSLRKVDKNKYVDLLYYVYSIQNILSKDQRDKIKKLFEQQKISYKSLEINETGGLEELKHKAINKKIKTIKIDINNFYQIDNLYNADLESLARLIETEAFSNDFKSKLLSLFERNSHDIEKVANYIKFDELDDEKKIVLYIMMFTIMPDGWFKRFTKIEYLGEALKINREKTIDLLFYYLNETSIPFHGNGMFIKALNEYNIENKCAPLIIDFAVKRLPDLYDFVNSKEIISDITIDYLIVRLILSNLNQYDYNIHRFCLMFIEEIITSNDYRRDYLIQLINDRFVNFNATTKIEMIHLFKKYNKLVDIQQGISTSNSHLCNSIFAKSNGIPTNDFSKLNRNEIIFALYLFSSYNIFALCVDKKIPAKLFIDLFISKRDDEKTRSEMKEITSNYSKRPLDNYILFDVYINAIDDFISEQINKNILKEQDVSFIIDSIVENDINYEYYSTNLICDNGFVKVAEYEIKEEVPHNENYFCSVKKLSVSMLDCPYILDNQKKYKENINYNDKFVFLLNPNLSFVDNIITKINNGCYEYYIGDRCVARMRFYQSEINGLESYYDRFYSNEKGFFEIEKSYYDELNLSSFQWKKYEDVIIKH